MSPTIAATGLDGSAEEVTVTLSSPTSLLCEVQSYPPAVITWLKDGTQFESSRNVRVLPGSAIITSPQNVQHVKCKDPKSQTWIPQLLPFFCFLFLFFFFLLLVLLILLNEC